eukprot:gene22658-34682_t
MRHVVLSVVWVGVVCLSHGGCVAAGRWAPAMAAAVVAALAVCATLACSYAAARRVNEDLVALSANHQAMSSGSTRDVIPARPSLLPGQREANRTFQRLFDEIIELQAFVPDLDTPSERCQAVNPLAARQDPPEGTLMRHESCGQVADAAGNVVFNGLRVRMGMHSGSVTKVLDPVTGRADYYGSTVNKAARVESCVVGGCIAVTDEVLENISGASLRFCKRSLGYVTLKGVGPSHITSILPIELEPRHEYLSLMRGVAVAKEPAKEAKPASRKEPASEDGSDGEMAGGDSSKNAAVAVLKVATTDRFLNTTTAGGAAVKPGGSFDFGPPDEHSMSVRTPASWPFSRTVGRAALRTASGGTLCLNDSRRIRSLRQLSDTHNRLVGSTRKSLHVVPNEPCPQNHGSTLLQVPTPQALRTGLSVTHGTVGHLRFPKARHSGRKQAFEFAQQLAAVERSCERTGGRPVTFVGDSSVVLWRGGSHCLQSVRFASLAVDELPPGDLSMGLCNGALLSGAVDSGSRRFRTVIGVPVELSAALAEEAARLEAAVLVPSFFVSKTPALAGVSRPVTLWNLSDVDGAQLEVLEVNVKLLSEDNKWNWMLGGELLQGAGTWSDDVHRRAFDAAFAANGDASLLAARAAERSGDTVLKNLVDSLASDRPQRIGYTLGPDVEEEGGPGGNGASVCTSASSVKLGAFTMEEVAENGFVVIDGVVHDVSSFRAVHPGGEALLKEYMGKDASQVFHGKTGGVKHSGKAAAVLATLRVGRVHDGVSVGRSRALRDVWAVVKAEGSAALCGRAFAAFFEKNPAVRGKLPADAPEAPARLVQSLAGHFADAFDLCVSDYPAAQVLLQKAGAAHRRGSAPTSLAVYESFGECFVHELSAALGSCFTREVDASFREMYRSVTRTLLAVEDPGAAKGSKKEAPPAGSRWRRLLHRPSVAVQSLHVPPCDLSSQRSSATLTPERHRSCPQTTPGDEVRSPSMSIHACRCESITTPDLPAIILAVDQVLKGTAAHGRPPRLLKKTFSCPEGLVSPVHDDRHAVSKVVFEDSFHPNEAVRDEPLVRSPCCQPGLPDALRAGARTPKRCDAPEQVKTPCEQKPSLGKAASPHAANAAAAKCCRVEPHPADAEPTGECKQRKKQPEKARKQQQPPPKAKDAASGLPPICQRKHGAKTVSPSDTFRRFDVPTEGAAQETEWTGEESEGADDVFAMSPEVASGRSDALQSRRNDRRAELREQLRNEAQNNERNSSAGAKSSRSDAMTSFRLAIDSARSENTTITSATQSS